MHTNTYVCMDVCMYVHSLTASLVSARWEAAVFALSDWGKRLRHIPGPTHIAEQNEARSTVAATIYPHCNKLVKCSIWHGLNLMLTPGSTRLLSCAPMRCRADNHRVWSTDIEHHSHAPWVIPTGTATGHHHQRF